jgi:uncharacterized protein (DUF779 family)
MKTKKNKVLNWHHTKLISYMIPGRVGVGIRGEVLRVQPQPEKHFGQKVEKFSQTCYF